MKRVVVTGIGVVSPIGIDVDEFFQSLNKSKNGIDNVTIFDASTFPCKFAGEVKNLNIKEYLKQWEGLSLIEDRKIVWGLKAVDDAIKSSGLSFKESSELGINMGVGVEYVNVNDLNPNNDITKKEIFHHPLDLLSSIVISHYNLNGPSFLNTSACAASTQAIGHSFQKIRSGEIKMMLAGGFDSMLNPVSFGNFALLGALSTDNDTPKKACRPFDKTRNGTVLGEGSAVFILEDLEHAKARGANIYAEVSGYGTSMDAYKVTDPHPEGIGATLAMRKAISDANIDPTQISYINAHGTSTPKNDYSETLAIKNTFGKHAYNLNISSLKSMIGHLIAAGGCMEIASSIFTLLRETIVPTINYNTPDPECDLNYTPNVPAKFKGEYILKNSFAFGGQNACIILRKYI